MRKFIQFLLWGLILNSSVLLAQQGSVKGFVMDAASGEPLQYVTVALDSGKLSGISDEEGFFAISNVPAADYKLRAFSMGFEEYNTDVTVKKNSSLSVKILMREKSISLQDFEVSARRTMQTTESRVSVTSISPKELKQIPTVGGEADVAQYLQVMPGIVSTGDQGGQIIIRGGTPVQTRFLLDGITIYNPFHSIGLFSVFETELIKQVDVYTGGFGAEYGGRISAVVDVKTKDGNRKKVSGNIAASPFMARASLEIPIIRLKEGKNTSAALLLSSKVSYLDRSSKLIYPYAAGGQLPFTFYDVYGKFSLNAGKGNKFSLSGFNFRDIATFNQAKYNWNTFGIGGSFLAVPRNSNIVLNTYFSYSGYTIGLTEADGRPRESTISGFNAGMDFSSYIRQGDLHYGLEIEGLLTDFTFRNIYNSSITQNENNTNFIAFVSFHRYWKKFVLEGGVRLQYYGNISAFSPEPRLSVKYNALSQLRFKMAGGLYSQNFLSTKSDKDVVNLFNGFITSPDYQVNDLNGQSSGRNLQRSVHGIFGIEADLPYNINLNIEPYYKYFFDIININRFKQFPKDADFLREKGTAWGVDVLLRWDYKQFSVYTAYALMYNSRNDGINTYAPHFDRRHNLNLMLTYRAGKFKNPVEISARWNLGSGFPFTQTRAFFEQVDFPRGTNTDPGSTNGSMGVLYSSQINGGRLPYYHRLDISIRKVFKLYKDLGLEVNASLSNVYNRDNVFYFDRITYSRVNQLPILPSLMIGFKF